MKESNNQDKQELLTISEVAELLRWYNRLSPAQKCTVPAGSGFIYNKTEEDLIEEYIRYQKRKK